MEQMSAEIKDKTQGRVEVKVYPANQLVDYQTVMEDLIRDGTIDMVMMAIDSAFDPRLEIIYIYGLIGDYKEAKKYFIQTRGLPRN